MVWTADTPSFNASDQNIAIHLTEVETIQRKPWRIGTEIYCDRDILPREVISRKLSVPQQHVRLRQWFWRSAFSERYRVGGEGFVTRDLKTVSEFVGRGENATVFGESPTAAQLTQSTFRIGNSRTRAFIFALAAMRPRNLTNGAQIDTAEALSQFNKKQFHHIHPRAHLKRADTQEESNSLVNICMLAAAANNLINDSPPQEYIPALLKTHADGDEILASNLMPKTAALDYSAASYAQFITLRSEILTKFVADLCDGRAENRS